MDGHCARSLRSLAQCGFHDCAPPRSRLPQRYTDCIRRLFAFQAWPSTITPALTQTSITWRTCARPPLVCVSRPVTRPTSQPLHLAEVRFRELVEKTGELPRDRDLDVVTIETKTTVAEIHALELAPDGELGGPGHVGLAVVDPEMTGALARRNADPVGLLDRHDVENPHRAGGVDERLGAARIVRREVAMRAVGLAQMMQEVDGAAGVVRDILQEVGERVDADVRVLIHEMHRDERIEDGDIDPFAPDRGDDGIAQLSVDE